MNVKENNVLYYRKCNHCQASEIDRPLLETPFLKEGISELGDFTCHKCGKISPVVLRFFV